MPSTALLVLYWATFRVSYIIRKSPTAHEEFISTLAALLNGTLFLGLMKYQSLHPEWAFYALLALGAIELTLGQLPITRRRRSAFLILTTIGVALIVAAFPFRYSTSTLSLTWLVLSQLLLAAGILTREVHFRRLGVLTAFASGAVIVAQAGIARQWDLVFRVPGLHEILVFALAALVFYLDAHLLPRICAKRLESDFERVGLRILSYFGFAMALATCAVAFEVKWLAITTGTLAVAFAALAAWLHDTDLFIQAPLYSVIAICASAGINTGTVDRYFGLTLRLISFTVVSAQMYFASFFHGRTQRDDSTEIRAAHTWIASILVGAVIWMEVPPAWIAVAWIAFAIVLMAAARQLRLPSLNLQSNVAAFAAIASAGLYNLPSTGLYRHDTIRLATILTVAAVLYATWKWAETPQFSPTRGMQHLYTGAATLLVSLLAWYELRPTSTVPALRKWVG